MAYAAIESRSPNDWVLCYEGRTEDTSGYVYLENYANKLLRHSIGPRAKL